MITRRLIFIAFINFWISANTFAQTAKNSITVFYTPQVTRTYFEQILKNNPGGFREFYETSKPDRPVAGYSFGASYNRQFKSFNVGIFIHQNMRGQRSRFAYNYRGLIPLDTLPGYGGLYYHFKMKSLTFGVAGGKNLFASLNFSSDLQLELGLDIYEIAFLEEFIIQTKDGSLGNGCCREEYLHFPGNYLKNLFDRFKDGYYRAAFSVSSRNQFKLFGKFYLEISPQIHFLTKILKKNARALDTYVPDGVVWAVGLQTGINYHF